MRGPSYRHRETNQIKEPPGIVRTDRHQLLRPGRYRIALLGQLQDWWNDLLDRKDKEHQALIDDHPLYNYGVAQSFRESMRSDLFLHYFQKLGGDVKAESLAVGAGAQAVQVSKPQPVSKPRFRRAAVGGES